MEVAPDSAEVTAAYGFSVIMWPMGEGDTNVEKFRPYYANSCSVGIWYWRVSMGKAGCLHAECAGPLRYTPVPSVISLRGSLCNPG